MCACSSQDAPVPDDEPNGNNESNAAEVVDEPIDIAVLPEVSYTSTLSLTNNEEAAFDNINDFSFSLFNWYCKGSTTNGCISPISAEMTLSLVLNVLPQDQQEKVVNEMFGVRDINVLNDLNAKLLAYLPLNRVGQVTMNIANSLWCGSGVSVDPSFASLIADKYNADTYAYDNTIEGTVKLMNAWVSKKTSGMVQDVFDDYTVRAGMGFRFVNVLYLNNAWQNEFDEKDTKEANFYGFSGDTITVDMMRNKQIMRYADNEDYQVGVMSLNASDNEFVIVMPKDPTKISELAASISKKDLDNFVTSCEAYDVKMSMPRMSDMSGGLDMYNYLKGFGITEINLESVGVDKKTELIPFQHIYCQIDEEGVRASSVTYTASVIDQLLPEAEMTVDHPFIYFVRNSKTGAILLAGVVYNL
jgi:serine protease inhibitor